MATLPRSKPVQRRKSDEVPINVTGIEFLDMVRKVLSHAGARLRDRSISEVYLRLQPALTHSLQTSLTIVPPPIRSLESSTP